MAGGDEGRRAGEKVKRNNANAAVYRIIYKKPPPKKYKSKEKKHTSTSTNRKPTHQSRS